MSDLTTRAASQERERARHLLSEQNEALMKLAWELKVAGDLQASTIIATAAVQLKIAMVDLLPTAAPPPSPEIK